MIIYLGADHRGFGLKEGIKNYLKQSGYQVSDLGAATLVQDDDYTDYAAATAKKVGSDFLGSRGILICGSGVGMDVTANRFPLIRSVLAFSPDQAMASRTDDDTNILSLPADYLDLETAKKIVSVWLQTDFDEKEGHKRRLDKIRNLRVD
ncbi:MAG: RpiB/LacA/LacB family sugar-phosphate isomerase [Patescibacteria group bacterium]|nr:RpiB/LacA/LacB family sugar-phosphate isomerase [Patescibacteria group bacterium]MDE2144499.1 RpiB/LacA/LacB family sugar-phosphate isomerase [Patescibacteria group bacterium]